MLQRIGRKKSEKRIDTTISLNIMVVTNFSLSLFTFHTHKLLEFAFVCLAFCIHTTSMVALNLSHELSHSLSVYAPAYLGLCALLI